MILIGNSPSSGSTLLADLLDSVPSFACGGELDVFSQRSCYTDFETVKKKGLCKHHTPATYIIRQILFKPSSLKDYNLDTNLMLSLLRESDTFLDFCKKIEGHYLRFRKKQVWIEKTPRNIHCAELFLDLFPDSYFIHIVRDPAYVLRSLIKHRGFPTYIALSVWLTSVLFAYKIEGSTRLITVRYEDLVQSPFVVTSNILHKAGFTVSSDEIEKNYIRNRYRPNTSRLKSWGISEYGTIGNANTPYDSDELRDVLYAMYCSRISKSYARKYCLPQKSVLEMIDHFGYEPKTGADGRIRTDMRSCRILLSKFKEDLLCKDACCKDFLAYMRPIVNQA